MAGAAPATSPLPAAAGAGGLKVAAVARRDKIVLRVTVPEAGRVSARATARVRRTRVRVGRASKAVRRGGEVRLSLAPSRAAKRALRGGNKLKVSLRITFQPHDGAPPSADASTLTLRTGRNR